MRYQTAPRIPIRTSLILPDGTVHRIPLDPAAPDAHSIIAAIQAVIEQFGRDPGIRDVAQSLLVSRNNNAVPSHVQVLTQWVMDHMVYLADPDGAEYIQTPRVLLNRIRSQGFAYGDCDDHVVLLGALLTAVGIPTRAVAVKLPGSPYFNHVVVEYAWNGSWTIVDPCAKDGPPPFYTERLIAV